MTKRTITLSDGNEVAYWTHHESTKPTLVMVHGFTGSHEGFQYLVPLLEDFHLIIPDLPGFGVSPLPHESLTLAHLGNLLAEFIDALKLKETPYLVGHSMGTLVVAEAVRQHPDIAQEKIVMLSPVPSPIGIVDRRRVGAFASQYYYVVSHRLPVVGHKLARSRKITRLSTSVIMTAKDKALRQRIHEHHFGNLDYISSVKWYSSLHRQINRTGLSRYRRALEKFDVLIVSGEKDAVTPIRFQKKAAHVIGAKLIPLKSVGHLAHYETPKKLATEILRFLR